jgi:hypothetical protein
MEVAAQEETEHGLLVVVVDEQVVADVHVVEEEEVVDEDGDETPTEEVVPIVRPVYLAMIKDSTKKFHTSPMLTKKRKWNMRLSYQGQ